MPNGIKSPTHFPMLLNLLKEWWETMNPKHSNLSDKMKPKLPIFQMEAIKSIRKPVPPMTTVERPKKGGGYRRRDKHKKSLDVL